MKIGVRLIIVFQPLAQSKVPPPVDLTGQETQDAKFLFVKLPRPRSYLLYGLTLVYMRRKKVKVKVA